MIARMTKRDVLAWVANVRHRNIARREGRCMSCSNVPRIMKIEIPREGGKKDEIDEQAIWWCQGCNAPAFGTQTGSYTNDRKLDYSVLTLVAMPKRQQELF